MYEFNYHRPDSVAAAAALPPRLATVAAAARPRAAADRAVLDRAVVDRMVVTGRMVRPLGTAPAGAVAGCQGEYAPEGCVVAPHPHGGGPGRRGRVDREA